MPPLLSRPAAAPNRLPRRRPLPYIGDLLSMLLASPLFAEAGEHIIPAGSLLGCTISEPRLSSKTTAVGDPVLCQLGHAERYGRSVAWGACATPHATAEAGPPDLHKSR